MLEGQGSVRWRVRAGTVTKVVMHSTSASLRTGEVFARGTLVVDRKSRPVIVKVHVEDRLKRHGKEDRIWIGVYDASGALLPRYSSSGTPPTDAVRLHEGDIHIRL